jgi:hypothetical protein
MKRLLLRFALLVVVLVAIGFMFVRSVRQTRAEPYDVSDRHLQKWELVIEPAQAPNAPLIALRPARELGSGLFRQLFARHAESFNGPQQPGIALMLQDEFNRSFGGRTTADELLELARGAGLAQTPPTPRCMGYRRDSAPGVTRQLYFVVFETAAFRVFREAAAAKALPGSGFDAAALSPVMFVAASDENFNQWLPLRASEVDCLAPITVDGSARR